MKKILILLSLFFIASVNAQNRIMSTDAVYDVVPGTKGNEITLSLENISEKLNAQNVQIKFNKIT